MDEILQRLKIVAEKATKLLESSLSGKVEEQTALKESLNGLGARSRKLNPNNREALRAQIDAFIEEIDACLKSLGE